MNDQTNHELEKPIEEELTFSSRGNLSRRELIRWGIIGATAFAVLPLIGNKPALAQQHKKRSKGNHGGETARDVSNYVMAACVGSSTQKISCEFCVPEIALSFKSEPFAEFLSNLLQSIGSELSKAPDALTSDLIDANVFNCATDGQYAGHPCHDMPWSPAKIHAIALDYCFCIWGSIVSDVIISNIANHWVRYLKDLAEA